ncbi:MAG TPA: type II toxin-antitoxin system RelE/ParE family toxin [Pararhizobium sp.]|uniref:type II toxin-antitoxin system RelE/ParE family toxin n=1 Tax=Pararhizobium sp. TaxID=1977563 RepID=UPI002CADB175|nr:type II toxin-antitoxin system RelE/ParE family toxin [Pararhizobium sp.]HTO29992.1 type II toxin-antitoxin system RelE/ParE family toxin [Pararhizobium sp.]
MTIKSRKAVFSRAARADLRSIYKYSAAENPPAAAAFVLDIHLKINSVAQTGSPGVARNQFSQRLRALPYRDRCIYFRVEESHIYIVRILHGRQDISPIDFPESEI